MYTDTPSNRPTDPKLQSVLDELIKREPIFHHPEFGTTRRDFDAMMEPEFWEVGASGRRYSREYVLDMLEKRHSTPRGENWVTRDFYCIEIAPDNYLLTYTLLQDGRLTRRLTIWRRRGSDWKIVFHQGTVVAES
jgi:hypothetical protein